MRVTIQVVTTLISVWVSFPARAQEGPALVNLPPATIAGEISAGRVSNVDKQGDWPAIAYARDGSLWAIWIEWNDKDADRLLVRRRDPSGPWGAPIDRKR